ncbi:MAG: hypothetical protein ACREUA_08720 [Burkholderiales bacterium]
MGGLRGLGWSAFALVLALPAVGAENVPPEGAQSVPHDSGLFRPDPSYPPEQYDIDKQLDIYGGKRAIETPRPVFETGVRQYTSGPFDQASTFLGAKNPVRTAFSAYGDWRNAVAVNDFGNNETTQIATRLNLDLDFKLTATERIHGFVRPFDKGGKFTRYEFYNSNDDKDGGDGIFDLNFDTIFFEGDLGSISSGLRDEYTSWDLPFAVGLMPLIFQNGIWVDDAFSGVAFTLPALNSPRFDISNMDFTFFAAFNRVTSGAIRNAANKVVDDEANVFGVAAFLETHQGYWELGYGYTDGTGNFDDQSYHNATVAFTKRYGGWLSNSVRVIGNFGQDRNNGAKQTADGYVFLIENSLITSKPLTLVPYLNLFAGFDHPQSLARDAGAGGVLKNTGINFETDGLTGFPFLDDVANNTYGGALGVQYLFDLDQQIIFEVATVQVHGDDNDRVIQDDQHAIGVRYQLPLTKAWLIRADAMAAIREDDEDISGVRFELRVKF